MALRTFLFFSILTTTILLSAPLIPAVDFNYPALFNFGDSNSDTGGLVSAGIGEPLDLPNGATYFHKPSGRFCDGRLIIDFLCNVSSISYTHTFFLGSPYVCLYHLWFTYGNESMTDLNCQKGLRSSFLPFIQQCGFSHSFGIQKYYRTKANVILDHQAAMMYLAHPGLSHILNKWWDPGTAHQHNDHQIIVQAMGRITSHHMRIVFLMTQISKKSHHFSDQTEFMIGS